MSSAAPGGSLGAALTIAGSGSDRILPKAAGQTRDLMRFLPKGCE